MSDVDKVRIIWDVGYGTHSRAKIIGKRRTLVIDGAPNLYLGKPFVVRDPATGQEKALKARTFEHAIKTVARMANRSSW